MYTPAVCGANTTIRRIIPHPFVPGILIPGTRSASPPSALSRVHMRRFALPILGSYLHLFPALSGVHGRHSLLLILGTRPCLFPAVRDTHVDRRDSDSGGTSPRSDQGAQS
jgi:hypothetical protein